MKARRSDWASSLATRRGPSSREVGAPVRGTQFAPRELRTLGSWDLPPSHLANHEKWKQPRGD